MIKDLSRQSLAALRMLLVLTVLLGVVYPVAVWAAGQAFGARAAGQPVEVDGTVVGSRLLGQQFEGEAWFHSRPSANDHDSLASAPSNLGPSSADLLALVAERRAAVAATEGVEEGDVPPDAVTASGSGLDPHVSPAYAALQAPRVARANGLELSVVEELVDEHTDGRSLGFLGEPGVNVLALNVAVLEARR
ncbi:potassium-transporting ATPase subunit KdpC [Nocardioides sp. zg-579]|uniref:Potassium-transporting ATPase KdpC subunit n=1 Tax=Nocardioides marmotae TaxID=2663857 RepID=A0A6I3JA95_9ACTN|nr:potassium-transporting ATPase subunit KdpC [Nocardioides marmotae]MCR6031489.1 potassium-transporting ATPase subunit KdpC [Gordonia jinghuaiqii]MTB95128.1 potassium-transporting ATPase subunit KdpC [Nocardioides marmotae]QKE02384.1 potassium-transporting ATPase subunit KdpC [Nocardioides marmotae]